VLQEKLKMIKLAPKDWHLLDVINFLGKIQALKERVSELNAKGEEAELSE